MSTIINTSNTLLKQIALWCSVAMLLVTATAHAEEITYYHHDALGSTVAATDENGALLWKEAYRPYGERIRKEDANTNDIWYTGKPHEEEMGLSYFGARWYDPNIGRFMAIDPVAVREGGIHSFNRYAYANNNPYKFVDPDGRNAALALCAGGPAGCVIGIGLTILAINQGVQGTQDALSNESVNNDDGDFSSNEGENSSVNKEPIRKKGDRFTDNDNASDQYEGIQKEQNKRRKKGDSTSIQSIEKSKQRDRNSLRPHNIDLNNSNND